MRSVIACAGLLGIALLVFAGIGSLIVSSHQAGAIFWLHASAYTGLVICTVASVALQVLIHAGK